MTDSCTTDELRPSPVTPCAECPWRVDNVGRPVPEKYAGTYARDQRVALWAELRDPVVQECHMGAGDGDAFPHGKDPVWIEAGFAPIPEHARSRECAGALIAVRREVARMLTFPSWDAYNKAHPLGFTKGAAKFWARRLAGEVDGMPPVRDDLTTTVEVVDPLKDDALKFHEVLTGSQRQALAAFADALKGKATGTRPRYDTDCTCDACARHGEVHAQTEVHTLAGPAMIDDPLVPLVTALTEAGVTTVASCVNLREVTDAVSPSETKRLMREDRRLVNYRHTLATGSAFVHFLDDSEPARAYLERLKRLDGVETLTDPSARLVHVALPLEVISALTALA